MNYDTIHIGKIIEEQAKKLGINKAELSRRINTSRQNIDNILSKTSIDTSRLLELSKILGVNFFHYYTKELGQVNIDNNVQNESSTKYLQKSKHKVTIQIEVDDPEKEASILKMVLG